MSTAAPYFGITSLAKDVGHRISSRVNDKIFRAYVYAVGHVLLSVCAHLKYQLSLQGCVFRASFLLSSMTEKALIDKGSNERRSG